MRRFIQCFLWTGANSAIWWEGYREGSLLGFIAALASTLAANALLYHFADVIMLSIHEARKAEGAEFSELRQQVESLSSRLDLPTPKLHVFNEPSRKAFVTGRKPELASLAVSSALVRELNGSELSVVILHELAHLRRDHSLSAIVARICRAFVDLASMGLWGSGRERAESLRRWRGSQREVEVKCSSLGCGARI
jgi:heat shock protein HtpX